MSLQAEQGILTSGGFGRNVIYFSKRHDGTSDEEFLKTILLLKIKKVTSVHFYIICASASKMFTQMASGHIKELHKKWIKIKIKVEADSAKYINKTLNSKGKKWGRGLNKHVRIVKY